MPTPQSLTKSDDREGGMRKRGGRGGERGGRERDKGKGRVAHKQWESVTFSSLLLGLWTATEPHSYVSQMLNQES